MDEAKVRKYVAYCRWVWLIGSALSVISAVVIAVALPNAFGAVLAGIAVVQALVAIPAALALPNHRNWARVTLMVLALLSIGSLYSALKMGAWPSLVLNLVLGSTFGVLANKDFRAAYRLPPARAQA